MEARGGAITALDDSRDGIAILCPGVPLGLSPPEKTLLESRL